MDGTGPRCKLVSLHGGGAKSGIRTLERVFRASTNIQSITLVLPKYNSKVRVEYASFRVQDFCKVASDSTVLDHSLKMMLSEERMKHETAFSLF